MLQIVSSNPFRTLGLNASATYSEVVRASRDIRSANKLKREYIGVWQGNKRLIPVNRTEMAINEALTTLDDPIRRVSSRLLWYHIGPEYFVGMLAKTRQPARGLPLNHDLALNGMLEVVHKHPGFYVVQPWHDAVLRWHSMINDSEFWQYLWTLEQDSGFAKPILSCEFENLREKPLDLPMKMWMLSAKKFLQNQDSDSYLRLDSLIGSAGLHGVWDIHVAQEIIKPLEQQLDDSAKQIQEILKRVTRKESEKQIYWEPTKS